MIYKDIRNRYNLGEYHSLASIKCVSSYGINKGCIFYKVLSTGDEKCIYTETFCHYLGMSDEDTCFWLLKYGKKLPTHVSQL